ncbi:MAG: ABC transporter substrate-binding protein [Candidatus Omnitrophota bacterium]|jgi:NitT/TauT family transport system substrate-binding protein
MKLRPTVIKILVIIVASAVVFFSVFVFIYISANFGKSSLSKEKKLTTINIAFQDWVGYGPFYLAQEKGFFKDEGLELVFIDEQLDSARRDAFYAGMLDCEAGTIDLLVSKRAQDAPIVAVLELDRSFGGDAIVAKEEIKSLEDLVGKRVVFSRDDVSDTFISYLFYKKGLPFNNIIIISRSPENVSEVFLDGEADAVVTWEPWITKSLNRSGAHILISSKDVSGVIVDTLNIREDIVKNNPELVRGLMRGWFKAVKYYREHPEEANRIIAKHYNISPKEYEKSTKLLKWTDYTEQLKIGKSGSWHEVFDAIAKIKFENGRITNKPDAKSAINTTLLERLYENSK